MPGYSNYAMYLPDSYGLDFEAIGKALKRDFKTIEQDTNYFLKVVANMEDKVWYEGEKPLFELARYLKGSLPVSRRHAPYETFFPFAVFFASIRYEGNGAPVWAFHENEAPEHDDLDTLEILFQRVWDKVQYGIRADGTSEDLLDVALSYADQLSPDHFRNVTNGHEKRILGMAEFLQENNQGTILLPQERLAKLLDMKQSTVNMLLQNIRSKGYLKLAMAGNYGMKTAHRYTFISPNKIRRRPKKK